MEPGTGLVSVAKKIVRAAVGVGLDEAGGRICGPTGWKFVKESLTPVFEELERRFPGIFLMEAQAEKAVEALSTDKQFEEMASRSLASLQSGQVEIMHLLAAQSGTLEDIRSIVDDAYAGLGEQVQSLRDVVCSLSANLKALETRAPEQPSPQAARGLTLDAVYDECRAWQVDAQRWMEAGDMQAASERLRLARDIAEQALREHANDTQLMITLGYIEKTQAQVAQRKNDYQAFVETLEKAARHFAATLALDPQNAGALNGMANVYLMHGDHRRAVELGVLAVRVAPGYGAALWDLAIAMEAQQAETGPYLGRTGKLLQVYRDLERVMVRQPEVFSARDLLYVRGRIAALRPLVSRRHGHARASIGAASGVALQ